MFRSLFLLGVVCISSAVCWAQVMSPDNPPITYSTPAVSVATAVDAVGRMAQKKLRVEEDLAGQPIILRVHYARFSDVLDWIAAATNAKWMDQAGYKMLRRTSFVSLSMEKASLRKRSTLLNDFVQRRMELIPKQPLTLESAKKVLTVLYDPKVDKASKAYKDAFEQSGDERLINFALQGVVPSEVISAPYPDHVVLSNRPRVLQGLLRFTNAQMDTLMEDQNVWTSALKDFAATHPKLKLDVSKRLPIPAKSRVILLFSDAEDGVPTHLTAIVAGPGGHTRVRAETGIDVGRPAAPIQTDWSTQHFSNPPADPISVEFLNAVHAPNTAISPALRTALTTSAAFDPFQFVVSPCLLHIGDHAEMNIVARPPDSLLLDPAFQALDHSDHFDAVKFLLACETVCDVNVKGNLMIIAPRDPEVAEDGVAPRQPLQDYMSLLSKKGYSLLDSEAQLASSNPTIDLGLVRLYAKLLAPNATPFLDASVGTLAFYGSLSPTQRATLNNGLTINVSDMTDAQKSLIPLALMDLRGRAVLNSQTDNILADTADPEITDLIDTLVSNDEKVFAQPHQETVIRVRGVDRFGRNCDKVFALWDAREGIDALGPWKSIEYATAQANTVKLTFHLSRSADYAQFIREYPSGFSAFGNLSSLPPGARKALAAAK